MNNFIMKLSGRTSAAVGGIADCASRASVLAFDLSSRVCIAAPVHDGNGRNPTCMRVGKAL